MADPFDSRTEQARIFLRVVLMRGERPADAVIQEALARGIKRATLTLARQKEHITTERRGDRWYWQYPRAKKS
jgi:hypothetical protein